MPIQRIFEQVDLARQSIRNLSVGALILEMRQNPDVLLLDIREIQERILLGTIPGAKHVPRGMLEFWADPTSPYARDYFAEDRRTILFCAGGGRSALAAFTLQQMGFTDVAHLEEGFSGWQQSGQDIEDVRSTSRWVERRPA